MFRVVSVSDKGVLTLDPLLDIVTSLYYFLIIKKVPDAWAIN